jgi:hypothetical protein
LYSVERVVGSRWMFLPVGYLTILFLLVAWWKFLLVARLN